MSVSSLKTYTRCSKQWELERFSKPRPPKRPAAWTARGVAVHDALLDWEQSERHCDVEQVYHDLYTKAIDRFKEEQPDYNLWIRTPRVKLVKTDIEKRREDGLFQIRKYIEDAADAVWEIARDDNGSLLLELQFEAELKREYVDPNNLFPNLKTRDVLPIRGAIDAILVWPDGSRTIRDLKTGNPEWDPRQVRTYGWVAQHHLGMHDIIRGDYYSTKLNREGNAYGSGGMIKLNSSTKYITDVYFGLSDNIDRRIFLANPSNDNCRFCPVRELCPEGK